MQLEEKLRRILTPEGFFAYDRRSGLCILVTEARSRKWIKPLYVQLQLTTECNRRCWWCYVEKNSISWDLVEAKKLLKFLDGWGVFGVALGGGEPFVYPHLVELVKYAWTETGLDVSLTTNGTASMQQVRDIEGYVSEVRVSVRTLDEIENVGKFLGRRFDTGVNVLVHRKNIREVEEIVEECLSLGVKDFLISSFRATGAARKFHELELDDFSQVNRIVKRFWNRATFKLDCMLAEKTDLPKFPFMTPERGRIIAITPDKKVKPSSLADESYSFENPEEIPEIYRKSIVG
jgi:MoaA/NifB/PqqE/SkfB family radical SAM enzyme